MTRLLLVPLLLLSWRAEAAIEVSFERPETYTDATLYGHIGPKARDATLSALRQHFEKLGARYLRPDQALSLQVTNIDLAGQYEPWRVRAQDVRFMRTVTWPKIALRYSLSQNGTILAKGEETVTDMNYLTPAGTRRQDDSLRYEKAMLEDWFRRRFAR